MTEQTSVEAEVVVGGTMKSFLESIPTSSLSPEETLRWLDSVGIESWVTEVGDLFIRYWQLGAERFIAPEHVARVTLGRTAPVGADRLEWVSQQLAVLRLDYAGKWVAITDEGVAASADDLAQLMAAVEQAGLSEPFITQISDSVVTWNTAYADD